jgi:hypothetical protein
MACVIGDDGDYTVKVGYNFLPEMEVNEIISRVLTTQWLSLAPSKVMVFSCQLILQRLPTRVNLSPRGIHGLITNPNCVRCPGERETEVHLFGTCKFALSVWSEISKWFGLQLVHQLDLCSSFDSFCFPFNCKKKEGKGCS